MGRESYRQPGARSSSAEIGLLCALVWVAPLGCDRAPTSPAAPAPSAQNAPRTSMGSGAMAREEARRAAEQYLLSGRTREALVITAKLIAGAPTGSMEHELHARALLAEALALPVAARESALVSAAEAYRTAAALDTENAALQHAAGVALDQANRLPSALEHYQRAVARDPSNPQFALYMGLALRRSDRPREALEILTLARALDPNEPAIEVALADALLTTDQPAAALEAARRAKALAPGDLGARVAEARSLRAVGEPLAAAESLSALEERARRNEAVAQELAGALLAIDRPEAAARAWELSLSTDPHRWRSALGAAESWFAAGDGIRAMDRLEIAESIAPSERRVIEVAARLRAAWRSAGAAPE